MSYVWVTGSYVSLKHPVSYGEITYYHITESYKSCSNTILQVGNCVLAVTRL